MSERSRCLDAVGSLIDINCSTGINIARAATLDIFGLAGLEAIGRVMLLVEELLVSSQLVPQGLDLGIHRGPLVLDNSSYNELDSLSNYMD